MLLLSWGFHGGSDGKESAYSEEAWVPSLRWEGPQRSLVGYSPWGRRVRHNWVTDTHTPHTQGRDSQCFGECVPGSWSTKVWETVERKVKQRRAAWEEPWVGWHRLWGSLPFLGPFVFSSALRIWDQMIAQSLPAAAFSESSGRIALITKYQWGFGLQTQWVLLIPFMENHRADNLRKSETE